MLIYLISTSYSYPQHHSKINPSFSSEYTSHSQDISYNTPCQCVFCSDIQAKIGTKATPIAEKEWTIIVYMAADNDLRPFAARNLNQMALVGSTENCNIAVHLDIKVVGDKKITRRYYIEKNAIVHVNVDDPFTQKMDSGDPETLYSCCEWAVKNYPAKNYCLIFWNHGTGALDPIRGRIVHPLEFFIYNPITDRYDLDRSIGFFDIIEPTTRGICWDDSTGNYLNNSTLRAVMKRIKTNLLKGKNFSIVGFDACLMAMLEVASIIKESADIMIGSQEVELGTGWQYTSVLSYIIKNNHFYADEFARHIVQTYRDTYASITNDYACSAINLSQIELLERNVHIVANLLLICLSNQTNNTVLTAISASRSRFACTHFNEPSYLDLHNLYDNLKKNARNFTFNKDLSAIIKELLYQLEEGCSLIKELTFANVTGKNLQRAQGISLYFPEKRMHPSYPVSPFAQTNDWVRFLVNYLNLIK